MKFFAALPLLAIAVSAAAIPDDAAVDAADAQCGKTICRASKFIRNAPCRCPGQTGPCKLVACPDGHRENCGANNGNCVRTT